MHSKNNYFKTWVEISKEALLHNFRVFQKIADKNTEVAAVVKANAYGHGLREVVSMLKGKVKVFAVDNLCEALQVKELVGKTTVLVLGYTTFENIKQTIEKEISFTIYSIDTLEKIVSLDMIKPAKIHLKVETGLNRQGVSDKELTKLLKYIKNHKDRILLEGISTHFANVEDTLDPSFAIGQLRRFKDAVAIVRKNGFKPKFIHCAASGAALLYKVSHFSLVRIGIDLYGLWPSRETNVALGMQKNRIDLMSVLIWKSIVAQVKEVEVGESVGYGRTWFASRRSKIAIIPVGYSDGYDRGLSNIGRVIIKSGYAPVIGRVAMNMIMVDITDIKGAKLEDEVILIGNKGRISVSAEEIAQKIGTINYEVVSRISPLIPRVIVK